MERTTGGRQSLEQSGRLHWAVADQGGRWRCSRVGRARDMAGLPKGSVADAPSMYFSVAYFMYMDWADLQGMPWPTRHIL